ncbi:hypothetical protein [Acuticoccus kandeliae]|uniref:hypothetical protein n=1 Tax=Acuticoccus kandeliae TaxID=2073160 RepID=UPI001300718C|nr:hypothetical protein [Acuticoccus kandeliae]
MKTTFKKTMIASALALIVAAPAAVSTADAQIRIIPQSEQTYRGQVLEDRAERQGEIREDRAERRGEMRAERAEDRGDYRQAAKIRRKTDERVDQIQRQTDRREDRAEYNNRRDGYVAQSPFYRTQDRDGKIVIDIN